MPVEKSHVAMNLLVDGRDKWTVRRLANGRVAIYRATKDWTGRTLCEYIGFYRGKPTVLEAGPDGSVRTNSLPLEVE